MVGSSTLPSRTEMNLSNVYVDTAGREYLFEYSDTDSFDDLPQEQCTQTYGVCFYEGKIVFGYSGGRNEYGLIGGTIEKGETFEQTLRREIQEESNMKILSFLPIGYQKVTTKSTGKIMYQLRYVCTAEPYGPFEGDPLGDIVRIELVAPENYREYLKWGLIGDRIIERALELLPKL